MQIAASTKLGFNVKRTMRTAQKLYEGINIGSETTGLITYMELESFLLKDAITEIEHVLNKLGANIR